MAETEDQKGFLKLDASSLRAYTMIAALAVIWLFFHWQTGGIFLNSTNLSNLTLQTAVTGIVAVGMLMVIVSGHIDLSVGSLLGLSGGVAAILMTNMGYGLLPSIIAAVAVGVLVGVFQGFLTAYAGIPAFIVTLGGLLAWRGAIKGLSGSETIPVADPVFKSIGQSYIAPNVGWIFAVIAVVAVLIAVFRNAKTQKEYGTGDETLLRTVMSAIVPIIGILVFTYVMNQYAGIPVPVLILLVIALIGYFITQHTTFGRYLYAIGGNAEAARLSGINTRRNIVAVYGLLGGLTGIAAIIFTARVGSATPDAGTLKELDAIAACVIGGASLVGGRGTIFGACLGALFMASLDNGMSLMNVRDFMQDIVKGVILVSAVGLDMIGKRSS